MTVVKMNRNQPNKSTPVEDSEEFDLDYEKELRKHRLRRTWIIIILVAVALVAIVIVSLSQRKTTYSGYKVENSIRRTDAGAAEYFYVGGNLFRCSRDGVEAYDSTGTSLWNGSYEVNNPKIEVGGSYFAVADLKGNDVFLFHATEGYLGSVNSSNPIQDLSVSAAGYVAIAVNDNGADYIHMYKMDGSGTKMYTIKKSINIDGLPVCMSASVDGEKLVCAYTGVISGAIKTNLVFSNFDAVGQNENERVVGGFDYASELIGEIFFTDNTHVVAVGEKSLDFYLFKEYPEQIKQIDIDYTIERVFHTASYVGLTHYDSQNGKEVVEIYNTSGDLVSAITMEYDDLTHYSFAEDALLAYGDSHCVLMNLKGNIIFNDNFEDGIVALFPIGGKLEYIYMNATFIQKIKLN